MRRGWRASPSSWTGMYAAFNAGFDKDATRKSPALLRSSVRACKDARSLLEPCWACVFISFPLCSSRVFLQTVRKWYKLVECNFLNEKTIFLLKKSDCTFCVLSMVKSFWISGGCDSVLSGCQPDPLRQITWC